MSPTGSKSGLIEFNLTGQFFVWVENNKTGRGFGSSTGFKLPNGAIRSPDLAWIRYDRWNALTKEEQAVFAPMCPDFVVELRSESDSLSDLQSKLFEYIENGAQLGWLIDPIAKTVYIYRPNQEVECLRKPRTLSGEPLLPGFTLDLAQLWD